MEPRQVITTNLGGLGWATRFNRQVIASDLDIISWDEYLGSGYGDNSRNGTGHLDPNRSGSTHDLVRGWKQKNFWVLEMPPGFKLMGSTDSCPIAGMADEARRFYAVQFHPEVTHPLQGRAMLERFVLGICRARPDWVMRDHIAEAVEAIRRQVGDEEVILGLSGGVDSSVAAALMRSPAAPPSSRTSQSATPARLDRMFAGRPLTDTAATVPVLLGPAQTSVRLTRSDFEAMIADGAVRRDPDPAGT